MLNYLFLILIACIVAYFLLWHIVGQVESAQYRILRIRKRDARARERWSRAKAKVIDCGYNVFSPWGAGEPDCSDLGPGDENEVYRRFEAWQRECDRIRDHIAQYGRCHLHYRYKTHDGHVMEGYRIRQLPDEQADLDLIYDNDLRPGSRVYIYYNPSIPHMAHVTSTTDESLKRYLRRVIMGQMRNIVILGALLAMIAMMAVHVLTGQTLV